MSDTIFALSSGAPPAGVGVIRVSGPQAGAALQALAGRVPDARRASLACLRRADGGMLDEALILWFPGPNTATGEDLGELHCHGGRAVIAAVEGVLASLPGLRRAEPGEFTQRAFLHGRLDLTQAEAVMDLISAQTDLALQAAHEQLAGRLGERLLALRGEVLGLLAHVEAFIDFPEEDIDPDTGAVLVARLDAAREAVHRLLATADQGRLLRDGVRTAIAGPPNVGKSSLLNRLLGFDRAIVSDIAGTTRDTLEEVINLRGLPLRLIDTAGLQASDPALRMQLESLAGRGIKAKNYLVLATTSQKQVLTAAYHSYKRCGLAGCILTKLDETASLGEVLSLAISHELPVAYLTDGPRIPDDLHLPRRHQLVSRAVSVQMQEEPSEEAMADMFADIYHSPTKRVG